MPKKKPTKQTKKSVGKKSATKKKQTKKTTTKKSGKKKKDNSVIVTSPVDQSVQLVVASEMADDQLIESELTGEVLPYFIYSFQNKGRTTTGLSVKGVSEVVRRLNRDKKSGYNIRVNPKYLRVEHNIDQEGEKGVQVSVYAENLIDGNSGWGVKFESYYESGKNGRYKNTFAVEKALSKAERNAKRKLIPEQVAVKMIEKMMKPSNTKNIEAPKTQIQRVKPLSPEQSTKKEIEETIIQAIKLSKSVNQVQEINDKTQLSDNFKKDFKDKVFELSAKRIKELQK